MPCGCNASRTTWPGTMPVRQLNSNGIRSWSLQTGFHHLLEFACRGEDTCGRKLSSFSSNMFTHGSMTLRQHRSHGTRVVLLADFTNKVGAEDWTLGTLAFSSKHDDKGSQLPASEAIPVAFLWCPTESARSYQAGLITFIEQFRLPLLLH